MSKSKSQWKMSGEELQQYLHFKSRGGIIRPLKGKGSKYSRKKLQKIFM